MKLSWGVGPETGGRVPVSVSLAWSVGLHWALQSGRRDKKTSINPTVRKDAEHIEIEMKYLDLQRERLCLAMIIKVLREKQERTNRCNRSYKPCSCFHTTAAIVSLSTWNGNGQFPLQAPKHLSELSYEGCLSLSIWCHDYICHAFSVAT